jgi:hypothetical protein
MSPIDRWAVFGDAASGWAYRPARQPVDDCFVEDGDLITIDVDKRELCGDFGGELEERKRIGRS